jgi:hypothetical protein
MPSDLEFLLRIVTRISMTVLVSAFFVVLSACSDSVKAGEDRPAPLAATTVLEGFKVRGLPSGEATARPSRTCRDCYIDRIDFSDTRLAPSTGDSSRFPDDGGVIEIYRSSSEATARKYRLAKSQQDGLGPASRIYLFGSALIQVSARLSGEQAGEYEAAIREMDGFGHVATLSP